MLQILFVGFFEDRSHVSVQIGLWVAHQAVVFVDDPTRLWIWHKVDRPSFFVSLLEIISDMSMTEIDKISKLSMTRSIRDLDK
jgi:hypothetical protein